MKTMRSEDNDEDNAFRVDAIIEYTVVTRKWKTVTAMFVVNTISYLVIKTIYLAVYNSVSDFCVLKFGFSIYTIILISFIFYYCFRVAEVPSVFSVFY